MNKRTHYIKGRLYGAEATTPGIWAGVGELVGWTFTKEAKSSRTGRTSWRASAPDDQGGGVMVGESLADLISAAVGVATGLDDDPT